jgi:hypothetical protein
MRLRDGYLEALEEYLVEVRRGCTRNRERAVCRVGVGGTVDIFSVQMYFFREG